MNDLNLDDLIIRHAGGKIYMIDIDVKENYYKPVLLNEMGEEILTLIKQYKDIDKTAENIAQKYEANKDMVKNDIILFLDSIKNKHEKWD